MLGETRGVPDELAVRLLGPFEVTVSGQPVVLTSGRLRTLLAVLALSAGKTVSVDRLVAAVWDEELPGNTRRSVQTYVTRLRAALGCESIGTTPAGYALRAEPDDVDALRFVGLLEIADRTLDRTAERDLLVEALALWRGAPFDGVHSDWLEHSEAPRLVERYLAGLERRIDLDLADGQRGELVGELGELTARFPLREPLWVRLLVVLDRCGRRAEALERYETVRIRLADELGTDPGPDLQQVYADLLAGRALQPAVVAEPVTADRPVPQQLPADIDGFTGRNTALKALRNLISEGDDGTSGAVVISVITGTAGVGKTALAVHWAHQVVDRFPDGQLYVDLRGFDPSGRATAPAEAIRGFLDALGVPAERIPPDLEAQVGLYRSLLAGRRVLVLVDNAHDADQVRPLLPGSPGCLVVVTSRNLMSGLVATEGARPLGLDLLTVDEARELLARRLGADRVAAEPEAVDEIITRCARLPLALAIAAARVASHPTFPLHTVASQLHDARPGLDAFSTGESMTDARTVFSWSYHNLGAHAARLFRLLGLNVGPDITARAAASLAGLPLDQTQRLFGDLTHTHLLVEHAPGRYIFHDLLRAYATELGHSHDSAAERHAALHRLLDHYLHTAIAATRLLNPSREHITVQSPQPGVTPEDLADQQQALAWFTAEHAVLRATTAHAAESGFDTHSWQLVWALDDFHFRQGHWHDAADSHSTALRAAQRLADQPAQAHSHRALGAICTLLGRLDDASAHLELALDLYDKLGNAVGQAYSHIDLSYLLERSDRHTDALRHAQQAVDLYKTAGDLIGEVWDLCCDPHIAFGWFHTLHGNYEAALTHCQQALTLNREIGNRFGEAASWYLFGYGHRGLSNYQQAADCFQLSIDLLHELGALYYEADARICLGDTHNAAGDTDAARTTWQHALTLLNELGHRDADKVRAKLQQLDQAPTPVRSGDRAGTQ